MKLDYCSIVIYANIVLSIHHYIVSEILSRVYENHCEYNFETQSCVSLEWKLLFPVIQLSFLS